MAGADTNAPVVIEYLSGVAGALNLTEGGLGQAIGDLIARRHGERAREELDPDGNQWEPNVASYANSPRKAGKQIGFLTGEMLSEGEIAGEVRVEAEAVEWEYGRAGFAKQKAKWFSEGTSRQFARPMIGLDEADQEAILELLVARIDAAMGR